MQADLDVGLLYKIMERLGALRANYPRLPQTADFLDLMGNLALEDEARRVLWLHVKFLEEVGLVKADCAGGYTVFPELTARGQMFVQSELAEFVRQPLLSPVLDVIESRIGQSAQSAEEKAGLIFKLRQAVADKATDVIAKVIVEIGERLARGGD